MLTVDGVAPPGVRVLTTTRDGGVSEGLYSSLNLAGHVGDDPAAVVANRQRLVKALRLPSEPAWLEQVHGKRVLELNEQRPAEPADAAFTRTPGVVLAVMTADCLPVVLSEQTGAAVAVVHAGWRGMAGGIIEAAVDALDIGPLRLQAWLGPAIGPAAYEVGAEVRAPFVDQDAGAAVAFTAGAPGKWQCDLYALARRRLAAAGVEAISGGDFCTYTESDKFFSYRRDGQCGRMATIAWI
ncbi:MAG TPA: peptidoglycan editing factor PgeF [Gammaproteobacteria bacterium]|nr:peptidoglycan editing factor PgeF [Gammaproteobacteria bacterium]